MCIRDSVSKACIYDTHGISRFSFEDVMSNYKAVSYTHLDVYKRQQQTGDSYTKKGEDFWDNYPSSYNSTISVSYTHLDVYKRQAVYRRPEGLSKGFLYRYTDIWQG